MLGIICSLILAVFAARNISPHVTISYLMKSFAVFVRAVAELVTRFLKHLADGATAIATK